MLLIKEARRCLSTRVSWANGVTADTVRNCWRKSGLTFEEDVNAEVAEVASEDIGKMADIEDQEPIAVERRVDLEEFLVE